MSFDKEMVRVYNYSPFSIGLDVNGRHPLFKRVLDPEYPHMETFTLRELEYVNAHTPVIRNGTLEFHEDEREEVYAALHYNNWRENCIFDREIDKMLTEPTFETMKKIIEVRDLPTIERIFAHMNRLIHSNGADVSSRVQTVVTTRRKEIREGVPTSRIQLTKKEAPVVESVSEKMIEKLVEAKLAEKMQQMEAAKEPEAPAVPEAALEPIPVQGEQEATAPVKAAKPRTSNKTKAK